MASDFDRVWEEFLLLISSREEARVAVQSEADSLGWTLYQCGSVAEGMEYLRVAQFRAVVCDENLPDGDWTSLLTQTETLPYRPRLRVIPRTAGCH